MTILPAERDISSATAERAVVELALAQHGVLTRAQLMALGVGPNAMTLRVRQRRLTRIAPGIYLLGPGPSSFRARCMAVVLATAGAVAGVSAARLRGYVARSPLRVEVCAPGAGRRRWADVRSGSLSEQEVELVDGIRVTAWPRTVIDAVARGTDARSLLIAVERAEGVLDVLALQRAFARATTRPGIAEVRSALRQHHPLAHRCRSDEEVALLYAIAAAGLPMPEVNNDSGGFEVDFCWRERRLIVEVDGRQHALVHQRGVDTLRDARHGRDGMTVLRVTARDVRERLDEVVAAVRVRVR